jgi:hypothetical protein
LRVSSEAEKEEPQPQNKRGKINTTYFVILEEKSYETNKKTISIYSRADYGDWACYHSGIGGP